MHIEPDTAPTPGDSQSGQGSRHINKAENTAVSLEWKTGPSVIEGARRREGSERDQRGLAEQENRVCQEERRRHS